MGKVTREIKTHSMFLHPGLRLIKVSHRRYVRVHTAPGKNVAAALLSSLYLEPGLEKQDFSKWLL